MPEEPDFERFGHADAWRLGRALVEQCQAENLPVTITITLGEQRVFHAALPGTSADNDDWAMRKIRVVRRFDRSSHEVGETYAAAGPERFYAAFGLPATDYAATGGAVPIRVRGTQVGVLAISGLSSFDDHERARRPSRSRRPRAPPRTCSHSPGPSSPANGRRSGSAGRTWTRPS